MFYNLDTLEYWIFSENSILVTLTLTAILVTENLDYKNSNSVHATMYIAKLILFKIVKYKYYNSTITFNMIKI